MITLGFAVAVPRLEIRTEGSALHPPENETVRRTATDRLTFYDPEQVIVVVAARAGGPDLATTEGFELLLELDSELRLLPQVRADGVRSLASLLELHISEDEITTAPYLASIPTDPLALAELHRRIRKHPFVDGTLLSPDGRYAALYVPRDSSSDRRQLIAAVEGLLETYRKVPFTFHLTGPQMIESTLGEMILADLARLVPIMVGVISLLLWLLLGTPGGVLVPMTAVPVVLIWTLGSMALSGTPLTLVTTLLPVILMAVTITDEIHLIESFRNHYRRARETGEEIRKETGEGDLSQRATAVRGALRELERPIVATSVTTGAGFLAFTITTLEPLRHFGFFCTFGILLAMVLTFTLIPALMITIPASWLVPHHREAPGRVTSLEGNGLQAWESWAMRLGARGPWIGLLILLAAATGLPRLRVEDNWIENFDPRSETVATHRLFNRNFWGSHRFDLVLTAPAEYFFQPRGIALVDNLVNQSKALPGVEGVMSYLVPVGEIARASGERRPLSELPDLLVADFLTLARMTEDPYELPGLVTQDGSSTRLQLFLRSESYRRDVALAQRLEQILGKELAGNDQVRAHFSGDLPVGIELVRSIVGNQLRSLGFTFVAVAFLTFLFFRSASRTVAVLAPVAATTLSILGVMAYSGIALSIATSMFAGLILGVGVDFGCHFLDRYQHYRRQGATAEHAITRTLATTGRAIRANALVLTIGFSVLAFSSLRPNHSLGLLLATALATSYLMTLLFLPGLLTRQSKEPRPASPLTLSSPEGKR